MTTADVRASQPETEPTPPTTGPDRAGWFSDLVQRARPFWPIGVVVVVVVALVGLALAWESPKVYRSQATVYAPSHVATMAAGDLPYTVGHSVLVDGGMALPRL